MTRMRRHQRLSETAAAVRRTTTTLTIHVIEIVVEPGVGRQQKSPSVATAMPPHRSLLCPTKHDEPVVICPRRLVPIDAVQERQRDWSRLVPRPCEMFWPRTSPRPRPCRPHPCPIVATRKSLRIAALLQSRFRAMSTSPAMSALAPDESRNNF
jgi:hypothetical protein